MAVAARTNSSSRPPSRSSSWSAYSSPNLRLGAAGGRAMGDSASAAAPLLPFSLALLVLSGAFEAAAVAGARWLRDDPVPPTPPRIMG